MSQGQWLNDYLVHYRASIAPIRRLPTEILSDFVQALLRGTKNALPKISDSLILLAYICHLWRNCDRWQETHCASTSLSIVPQNLWVPWTQLKRLSANITVDDYLAALKYHLDCTAIPAPVTAISHFLYNIELKYMSQWVAFVAKLRQQRMVQKKYCVLSHWSIAAWRLTWRRPDWRLRRRCLFLMKRRCHSGMGTFGTTSSNPYTGTITRDIAFASYGSVASRFTIAGIVDAQRVTLRAVQHKDDLPPVGLFFTGHGLRAQITTSIHPSSTPSLVLLKDMWEQSLISSRSSHDVSPFVLTRMMIWQYISVETYYYRLRKFEAPFHTVQLKFFKIK